MTTSPRVTVVVLNWNGLADTLACLESLGHSEYPALDRVVVDNGSTDGSVSAIHKRFPAVTVLENKENLGYTGGNNRGLRHALAQGADYALLLNNDTEVAPDMLGRLVEAVESDSQVGLAGPTIYYYGQPDVIWSAGGMANWRHGSTTMVGVDEPDRGQFGVEPRTVDFASGCALLARSEVLKQVGLLDERFFAYFEEVEWCVRAARAGYKTVHVPAAHIWHKIAPSARAASPLAHYYMTRNRLLFLRINAAAPSAWLHTLIAEYLRTLISWSVKPRWRHMKAQRRVMLQAILDASRNRWGKQPIRL